MSSFVMLHINKWMITLICVIILLHIMLMQIPSEAQVHFLNIGQGDACLIISPDLHTILIDGGPGEKVLEELGEVLPFFVRTIDIMVLTHPHRDHMEGLIEVLNRYKVNYIMLAGDAYGSGLYREFLKRARETSTVVFTDATKDFSIPIKQSDSSSQEALYFDVLHPIDLVVGQEFENTNNASVVIRMTLFGQSPHHRYGAFLFTGDCEEECEYELLTHYSSDNLKSDVLKVGHHGSRTSTTQEFLRAVSPEVAVIQSGKDNQFEHPHPETIQKLLNANMQILRNDLEGRITLPVE